MAETRGAQADTSLRCQAEAALPGSNLDDQMHFPRDPFPGSNHHYNQWAGHITTLVFLRIVIIRIGSTLILMGVEP